MAGEATGFRVSPGVLRSSSASSPRIGRYQAGWKPVARGESADNAPSQGKIATPEIRRAKSSGAVPLVPEYDPAQHVAVRNLSAVSGRISPRASQSSEQAPLEDRLG